MTSEANIDTLSSLVTLNPGVDATTYAEAPEAFPALKNANTRFLDVNGIKLYPCSAIINDSESVHPGKCSPDLFPYAHVPYGGRESLHYGKFKILDITNEMEWVPASDGRTPEGRRPVAGGFESNSSDPPLAPLYFASVPLEVEWEGETKQILVPGKVGPSLGAAYASFGGCEHIVKAGYEILCYKA